MEQVLFITVRYSSSRLPGKCLQKLGNNSVLGHCILRAKKANFRVIVCTGSDMADTAIVDESIKYGCEVFTGDSLNKILRWSNCFQNFGIEFAHIVDGDDPYFDPIEINESLNLLVSEKLDLVRTSLKSDSGFASVGLSVTAKHMRELALRSLNLNSQDLDVVPWNLLLNGQDNWKFSPDNHLIEGDSTQLRLTLDYPEDLELLQSIALKLEYFAPRIEVEKFVLDNPNIYKINTNRNIDFIENKRVQLRRNFNY